MLLVRYDAATTPPPSNKAPTLSEQIRCEQIQSRALWRLRASFAETESFSDVVRMEHFASSPEVPSSMTSFESNATPATAAGGDWRSGTRPGGDFRPRAPVDCPQADVTTPAAASAAAAAAAAAATVGAGLAPSCSGDTRRQAFRRAIAQRWTAARINDGDRRPQTSFDSMETDGDVSDTSCRPDMTTSFDSTTTTTTTTTDNTDDVDNNVQRAHSPHDSGYRSVEV